MAYIISVIIAYLGYSAAGYDFFILLALISLSIDIYKDTASLVRIRKRYLMRTKDKTARR